MFSKKQVAEFVCFDSNKSLFFDTKGHVVPENRVLAGTPLVSTIPSWVIQKATVGISKGVSEEILEETLLEAASTQLGIDFEDEPVVQYQRRGVASYDSNQYEYDLFIIPRETIENALRGLVQKSPYVDCVVPYLFLPSMLYKRGFLSPKGSQIFVHFGDEDAFFALFDEGEMVYSKSLEGRVGTLREAFISRTGLDLGRDEFVKYISGEAADSGAYQGVIETLYQALFVEVEEALSFAKRLYLDIHPEILYFNSPMRLQPEFYTYLSDMLMLRCTPASSIAIGMEYEGSSLVTPLAILYAEAIRQGEKLPNFTIYPRPAPLLQRDSGKILGILALSLLVALVYPVYNVAQWVMAHQEIERIEIERQDIGGTELRYQSELAKLKEEREGLQKSIDVKEEHYKRLRGTLEEIYTWQKNYVDKSQILNDFLKASHQHGISLEGLMIIEEGASVWLEAKATAMGQKSFSGFLRRLGESERYIEVGTEEIQKEEGRYRSTIKAVIR